MVALKEIAGGAANPLNARGLEIFSVLDAFNSAVPNITTHEVRFLLALWLKGGTSDLSAVRETTGLSITHFNKVQAGLEQGRVRDGEREGGLKLITVELSKADRRARILCLAARGRKLIETALGSVAQ